MTSKVLDFGGPSRDAIFAALRRLVAGQTFRIMILRVTDEKGMNYRGLDGSLAAALALVADGNIGSVQIEGTEGSPLLAGLYRPGFENGTRGDWSVSAEGLPTVDAEALFYELQSIDGLSYVALSSEESPDFDADHINEETFPWLDWRLLAGAVRAESGNWIVQRKDLRAIDAF